MSSRPVLSPYPVITNGDMSQATIISKPTIMTNMSMVSYDISWTGASPVGNLSIQVSNTYQQAPDGTIINPGNWTTLTLSSPTAVSGNTGNGFIDIEQTGAYAICLVYTRVSGTGTLNAVVAGKVQ
jgi:hypothetical protein